MKKIDVVIPVLSSSDKLIKMTRECIHSILKNDRNNFDLHVYIIESGPIFDYQKHFKDQYPNQISIIKYPSKDFCFNKALNIGLKFSRKEAEYIYFVNNDVLHVNATLLLLTRAMEADQAIYVASPKDLDNKDQFYINQIQQGLKLRYHMLGYSFICKTELFDKHIQKFDESVDFWYSDNLFLDQLQAINKEVYIIPNAQILHRHSQTLATLSQTKQIESTIGQTQKLKKNIPTSLNALMISYTGETLVVPSILSIYDHVDNIIMIHANKSWTGVSKPNKVKSTVLKHFSNDPKILHIDVDVSNILGNISLFQYQVGKLIIDHFFGTPTFIVDTDEVWTEQDLLKLKEQVQETPTHAIFTGIRTFIKQVNFRVDEKGNPLVIAPLGTICTGPRFSNLSTPSQNKIIRKDIAYDHYTSVRGNTLKEQDKEIFDKTIASLIADGNDPEKVQTWVKTWFSRIWKKLPNTKIEHVHPAFKENWNNLRIIPDNEINSYIKEWMKTQNLNYNLHKIKKPESNAKQKTK